MSSLQYPNEFVYWAGATVKSTKSMGLPTSPLSTVQLQAYQPIETHTWPPNGASAMDWHTLQSNKLENVYFVFDKM